MWQAHRDHFTQSVHIVCIQTHYRTVCMRIKKFDRKPLHMGKHIDTNLTHCAGNDIQHQTVKQISTQNPNAGYQRHDKNKTGKT